MSAFSILLLSNAALSSVIHVPFKQSTKSLHKRDDTVTGSLENQKIQYEAHLKVGTPSQSLSVQIDTGSSDLWLMSSDNPYCNGETYEVDCSKGNVFDYEDSSSFSANNSDYFQILYGDKTFAIGVYAQDSISIGGAKVDNANFAVAVNASTNAVFGVGLASDEITIQENNPYRYPSFPYQLKDTGAIDSVAYSVWLNDVDARGGEILFGGIDTAKYQGQLKKLPLVPTVERYVTEFSVMMQGISLANEQGDSIQVVSGGNYPVVIDTGTSLTAVSEGMLESILSTLGNGVEYDSQAGLYTIECGSISGSVGFNISGINIEVALSDFFTYMSQDNGVCTIGFQQLPQSAEALILGDNALRFIYTVFDLENKEIALAPAKYNSSSSSIIEISSGIPSAVQASGYSSTTASAAFSYSSNTAFFAGRSGEQGGSTATASTSVTSIGSSSINAAGNLLLPPVAIIMGLWALV